MSEYSIEVSPQSRVVVFQGTLKKAPQLNKRGRKKWKDRFIVLRACKTLECFKSKKALDSSKSPRKVIDIRECINLEVGLEYKELQHIFSLGTFKRSFFFAAPSDALMLQWVDNIEKVKNALHGDRIRVLDIGLRKSPMRTTASSICTSQSMSRIATLCSSNPSINQIGSLSTLSRNYMYSNDRSPSLPPQAPPTDHTSSPSPTSSNNASPAHRRGHYYVNVAPVRFKSRSSQSPPTKTSPEHTSAVTMPPICHKIPNDKVCVPPHSTRSSENAVHVVASPTKHYYNTLEQLPYTPSKSSETKVSEIDHTSFVAAKRPHPQTLPKLHSSPQHIPGKIPPPKLANRSGNTPSPADGINPFVSLIAATHQIPDGRPLEQEPEKIKQATLNPQGMRRSFRYRKITLRKEKPVFTGIEEDEDESSDETDRETSVERGVVTRKATPSQLPPSSLYQQRCMAKSSPNLSEIGRPKAGRVKNTTNHLTNQNVSSNAVPPTQIRKGSVGVVPSYSQPNYSKVTVVGVKVQNCDQNEVMCYETSLNYNDNNLSVEYRRRSGGVSRGSSLRNSNSDGALCSPLPSENLYLPDPLSDDEDLLPDRYSSGHIFDTTSVSSLDAVLVDPPLGFNDNILCNNIEKDTLQDNKSLFTDTTQQPVKGDETNRSSTESCDTGYTSSPTYNSKGNNKNGCTKWSSEGSCLPHSEKTCTPLVFYTNNVWRPQLLKATEGLISVQVCLVEQCPGLMEDFLSLKAIEGYKCVESEVEQGNGVTTPTNSDIMTVETSLEDLEFGFKVVRNTQKDLFQKKVKVFDFELENLFNKKEFSCDVKIKCSNDTVTIPIEFEL